MYPKFELNKQLRLDKVAKVCKEFRVYKGITQKEIANMCNVHPSLISHFENGHCDSAHILLTYITLGVNIYGYNYK